MGDQVRINMSEPHSLKLNQALNVAGKTLTVHSVNTGVPHAVVFVDDLEKVEVLRLGAGLRYHEAFAPKGTNANFVKIVAPGQHLHSHLRARRRGRDARLRHRHGRLRADRA